MRAAITLFLTLATLAIAQPARADAHAETVAKEALKSAEADYLGMNYGSGASRLQKALKGCGANKCSAATRAALMRDIGAMQFRKGDKNAAKKSWASAAKLQPGIALNAAYDAPDLRAAFEDATAGAGGGGGGASGPPPAGDFTHTPAMEQKVNTPLPVYVENAPDEVAQVVVKYKGATMSAWRKLDLDKVGDGWGGLIPCSDVTSGTMRYYIQGLNKSKEPIANSGDAKHPFTVAIKQEISGDEPSLPGMKPPKQCGGASADCPPDFPGCSKSSDSEGGDKGEGEGGEGEGGDKKEGADEGGKKSHRLWIGVAGALDFMHMPAGQNVCRLNPPGQPNAAQPANSANYYCTNQDGSDFPSRNDGGLQNGALHPGTAGNVSDGIAAGNVRLMLSLDYAITKNILLGARLGVVLFEYPGGSPTVGATGSSNAAVNDGRASSLGRLHLEVRGTYLFGQDPLAKGFAPMVFLGGGVSEFDARTSDNVALYPSNGGMPLIGKVNIWRTDGPGFLMAGAGVRWGLSDRWAALFGLRLNLAIGGNGAIPTLGPELGVQYGF